MRAAVLQKPNVLVIQEVEMPAIGEYDALCESLYGGTCVGTDGHLIHNTFPFPVDYPAVLGHETIGRVIKTGEKVRNFKVGDLVTRVSTPPPKALGLCWGGFAEFAVAKDHKAMQEDGLDSALWDSYRVNQVVPEGIIDPQEAVMIITWRETLSYIKRFGVSAGGKLLIIGSGANGFSFAAHAKNIGASVCMIGSASRKSIADQLGVELYCDYTDPALFQRVKAFGGFDFIIDAVCKKNALNTYLPLLNSGGTVGIYGLDDFLSVTINPLCAGSFTFYNAGYDEAETHEEVIALIRDQKLNAKIFMDPADVYDLDEIAKAYEDASSRRIGGIKSVIKIKR